MRKIILLLPLIAMIFGCQISPEIKVGVEYKEDATLHNNIKYALLCGVSNYKNTNISKLPFITENLDKLAVALRDKAGFTHIIKLKDAEVTKNIIKSQIDEISKKIHGENNVFLFYFGGHGIAGSRNERLLFTYDTSKNDKSTTLSDNTIKEYIGMLKNNALKNNYEVTTIAMFDACYSTTQGAPPIDPNPLNDVDIIFDSCKINQNSYEGIFTSKFCENLKRVSGNIDFRRIFDNTKRDVEQAKPDQSPFSNFNLTKFTYTPSNKVPYRIEIRDESNKIITDAYVEYDSRTYKSGETCYFPVNSSFSVIIHYKDTSFFQDVRTESFYKTNKKIVFNLNKPLRIDTPDIEPPKSLKITEKPAIPVAPDIITGSVSGPIKEHSDKIQASLKDDEMFVAEDYLCRLLAFAGNEQIAIKLRDLFSNKLLEQVNQFLFKKELTKAYQLLEKHSKPIKDTESYIKWSNYIANEIRKIEITKRYERIKKLFTSVELNFNRENYKDALTILKDIYSIVEDNIFPELMNYKSDCDKWNELILEGLKNNKRNDLYREFLDVYDKKHYEQATDLIMQIHNLYPDDVNIKNWRICLKRVIENSELSENIKYSLISKLKLKEDINYSSEVEHNKIDSDSYDDDFDLDDDDFDLDLDDDDDEKIKKNKMIFDEIIRGDYSNYEKLTYLTPEVAHELAKHKGYLWLNDLTTISVEVTRELAKHKGKGLELNGLTLITVEVVHELAKLENALTLNGLSSISEEVACELAKHKGMLFLEGLTSITVEVARELAKHKGVLSLKGLTSITAEVASAIIKNLNIIWSTSSLTSIKTEVARELAKHEGVQLNLSRLTSISVEVARELAKHKGRLDLNGLTTLTVEVANELAKHEGELWLNGLTTLTGEVARELAKHEGELWLNGLLTLSVEVARELAEYEGWIYAQSDILEKINKYK